MSITDTTTLDEKRKELKSRIDFLDDPTLGSRANNEADKLREKLESLESVDADAYEQAQEILKLRDERDALDSRISMLSDSTVGADDRADELRDDREEIVDELGTKEDGFESQEALDIAAETRSDTR